MKKLVRGVRTLTEARPCPELMLGRATRRLWFITCLLIGLIVLFHARYKYEVDYEDDVDEGYAESPNSAKLSVDNVPQYPPLDQKQSMAYPEHRKLANGLVETNMEGKHPIADLIDQASSIWQSRLARQSKTLGQAVKEYTRRYGRSPPKGFDNWWRFATDNNVILVDEFDQINHNIEPYFALLPATFAERVDKLAAKLDFSFNILIRNGTLTLGGERATSERAQDIKELVEPFAQWLPDLEMYASDHDKGNIILGQDQYDVALELASEGSYFTPSQLKHYENLNRNSLPKLKSACHPYSNAVLGLPAATEAKSTHTFLADPLLSMNYCSNPSLMKLHGSWAFDHALKSELNPMWVHCKWIQDPSFLLPALPGFSDIIRDPQKIVPWSERRDSRLFWRARSTGVDFHTGWDWRAAHRVRLHFYAMNTTGDVELLQESGDRADGGSGTAKRKKDNSKKDPKRGLVLKSYPRAEVTEKYLDVGLVGPLVQCTEPGTFCGEVAEQMKFLEVVSQSRGQDVKFVADIDGNGWSQRYARLLSTGSVVFKSTVFPEWNTNWLVPYYHYIPVKVDYTDLFDTMAFFAGWPDGTPGHDDLAEKIGMNAVRFTRDHWRWQDAQAYMFRLLLEYARLASPDRDEASYHG